VTVSETNAETTNRRPLDERDMLSRSCHAQRDVTGGLFRDPLCHALSRRQKKVRKFGRCKVKNLCGKTFMPGAGDSGAFAARKRMFCA
jgi:hypothetical protein